MTERIHFGFKESNRVQLYEFCEDPDGSNLQWFKPVETFEELIGREKIATNTLHYKGNCYDTGDYFSHLGELAKKLITEAPEGASLVALTRSSLCGTRTFSESLTGEFYK